jgi:hypothetical protein
MEFLPSLLLHLSLAFAVCWRLAYLVIAAAFIVEALRALREGHPCRLKVAKAASYVVIALKALLT